MRKLIAIGVLAGAMLASACSAPANDTTPGQPEFHPYRLIKAQEAKDLMGQLTGYVIVDVRTLAEYQSGHVDGAISIPVDQITQLAPTKLPDLGQVIFVYCRSGARAATASQALAQMGYSNVYDFGGIIDWPYGTVTG